MDLDLGIARPCSWPASIERIARNFCEKRLTGEGFHVVVKAFDTVCIDGLLYKLTPPTFPSCIVHSI